MIDVSKLSLKIFQQDRLYFLLRQIYYHLRCEYFFYFASLENILNEKKRSYDISYMLLYEFNTTESRE